MGKLLKFEDQKGLHKKKNFYLTLAICLMTVGIVSWTTYNKVKQSNVVEKNIVSERKSELPIERNREANNSMKGVILNESDDHTNPISDNKGQSKDPASKQTANAVYPCDKKEPIQNFSVDVPIYSKTFDDWRAHNGVDFAIADGEKIKAITKGIVSDVYDDTVWGKCVVINHDNDFTATYAGFGEVSVTKDQEVAEGTELGSVGEIPAEILDGPHLHLMVKKQDQIIDPMQVINAN